jgi:hypothetical protein
MNRGIIYLIQPVELIGTNCFKVGYSDKTNLERLKGYKKGSRYINIGECIEPKILEKKIIENFNKNFKLKCGKEYFEGDEDLMEKEFLRIKIEHLDDMKKNNCLTNAVTKTIIKNIEDNEFIKFMKNFNAYEIANKYTLIKNIKLLNSNNKWYILDSNNIYNLQNYTDKELEIDITNNFIKYIEDNKKLIESDDIINLIEKNIKLIKTSRIIKESIQKLTIQNYVKDLDGKINVNNKIIAFNNYLFDLEKGDTVIDCIRPIMAEDYISYSLGYNFTFDINLEIREKILTYLKSCFDSENKFNEWLIILALSLFGYNFNYIYLYYNFEDIFYSLIEQTFGNTISQNYIQNLISIINKKKITNFDNKTKIIIENETTNFKKLLDYNNLILLNERKPGLTIFLRCPESFAFIDNNFNINQYIIELYNCRNTNTKFITLDETKTEEFKQQFILILLEISLKNKNIEKNNFKYVININEENFNMTLIDFFKDNYNITNTKRDKIKITDIYLNLKIWIKESGDYNFFKNSSIRNKMKLYITEKLNLSIIGDIVIGIKKIEN